MALNREETLLLEEYKNCTEVALNEARLFWSRYQTHLALNSGLLTVWSYFSGLYRTYLLTIGLIGIAFIGIITAIIWFLNIARAYALSVYWNERLNEIEKELPPLKTFSRVRYEKFWKTRRWFEKRRISIWSTLVPLSFIGVWLFLAYVSFQFIFSPLN